MAHLQLAGRNARAGAAAVLAVVLLLPVLLAGCGSDGSDAGGPRPDLPVGPARQRFTDAGSFALALGADTSDGAVVAALGRHDLVVVDGEGTTAAQVAALQDGGTVVLAYLSVGTLEPGRPWFAKAEDGGWLLDHWDDWDEWYAAVDQRDLRDLLLGVAADELGKGFDGLFLDNVDMVEAHPDQAQGMEQLVADLDDLLGPDRLLVSQNGDESVDRFVAHLDGWNREDVSATYDFDAERYVAVPAADTEAAVATLERLARRGLLVTATDYAAEPTDPLVATSTDTACAAGAVPFASTIDLDRIPPRPGPVWVSGRIRSYPRPMGRIRVSTIIDAPPAQVWDEVRVVERHVDWMADAVAIHFRSRKRAGVGTVFDCDTKVGPLRLKDRMEITEWREGKVIGVRHVGLVTGTGRFTISRARGGRTRFTWQERLKFPLWMGGPVGGLVGGRVMRRIWKKNLRVLRELVETGRA